MGELAGQAQGGFSERLVSRLDDVEFRRANDNEDREAICRLRYRAYLEEGIIPTSASERLTDRFDDAPNSFLFGLYVEGKLASSIRIGVASEDHGISPAVEYFPDILEPEMAAGHVIVDPNRLVTDGQMARRMPELVYLTVRLGYVAAWHFSADIVTATVRAEHRAFYRRVFGMRPECLPRLLPPVETPYCLVSFRDQPMANIMNRYPAFRSSDAERATLFGGREPDRGLAAISAGTPSRQPALPS